MNKNLKILDKQYLKWERNKQRLTPWAFCDFWTSVTSTISHTTAFFPSLITQIGTDIRVPSSYFSKYWHLKTITYHHLFSSSFHKRMNWYQKNLGWTWTGKESALWKILYIIPIILIFVLIWDNFSVDWNWFVGQDFKLTAPVLCCVPASWMKAPIPPIQTFYS